MHPIINKIRMLTQKGSKDLENYTEVPLKNSDMDPKEAQKQKRLQEVAEAARRRRTGGVIVFGSQSSTKEIIRCANDLRKTLQEQSKVNEMLRLHYVMTGIDEGKHVLNEHEHDIEQHMYELEQGLKSSKEISDFLVSIEKRKNKDWQKL